MANGAYNYLNSVKPIAGQWLEIEKTLTEAAGVKHYTKDGKEWTGATHKMPNGTLMTQDPHSKDSEELFHKEDVTEAAPKMRKNKEAENLQKLMNLVANAQKGGMGSRYGKEFDKAKLKALRAMKDMVTYSNIGV